jgi:hypothetical protein
MTVQRNLKQKTKSTSIFFDASAISDSVVTARTELREICAGLMTGKKSFLFGHQICNATPLDFHRALAEWHRDSKIDVALRNILLSCFYSAEVKHGGAGLIACLLWLDMLNVHETSEKTQVKDVNDVIMSWGRNGLSTKCVTESFKLGACGCFTEIRESKSPISAVKVLDSTKMSGHVDYLFASKNEDVPAFEKFYVVAIDGIVESVSQINNLIEMGKKSHVVIAARGFLPDVSNTLSENFFRKNLKIVPYVVDDWGVENFLDLSKIGFSCVSSIDGGAINRAAPVDIIEISFHDNVMFFKSKFSKNERKIMIDLGSDLGFLLGISKDRVKLLLSLMRSSARSGVSRCQSFEHQFYCSNSSIMSAKKSMKSLQDVLQNLGGLVILQ